MYTGGALLDGRSKMDQSEITLIHFDSIYYIPEPVPMLNINILDNDINNNGFGQMQIPLLINIFKSTNIEELMKFIKCVPVQCEVCGIFLSDLNDLTLHLFTQTHMDKFLKDGGSITTRDFNFWVRLLSLFPMISGFTLIPSQQRRLQVRSKELDLHSRLKHFTVEVSSYSEYIDAALLFISASTFYRSERVVVYCMNLTEKDWFTTLYKASLEVFDIKSSMVSKIDCGYLCAVSIEPPGCDPRKTCALFIREPGGKGRDELIGSFAGYCAFKLCDPAVQSSLILVEGKKEKELFREFEKKFMHENENLLPIYDITLLKHLKEMAKVQFEKKCSMVAISIHSPAPDPIPTTVPPLTPDPPCTKLTTISPSAKQKKSSPPHPVLMDTPITPSLPKNPIAATPLKRKISVASQIPLPPRKTPVVSIPSTHHETMAELRNKEKMLRMSFRRLDDMDNLTVELFDGVLDEQQELLEDQEILLEGLKKQVEESNEDQRSKRIIMVEIEREKKRYQELKEIVLRSVNKRGTREYDTVPVEVPTVPTVPPLTPNPPNTKLVIATPAVKQQKSSSSPSVSIDTPIIPSLPKPPIAATPSKYSLSIVPHIPIPRKTPVITVPSTYPEIVAELSNTEKRVRKLLASIDDRRNPSDELFDRVFNEVNELSEDQEMLLEGLKKQVEEMNGDHRLKRKFLVEIEELKKDHQEMNELSLQVFNERATREAATVPVEVTTVPTVARRTTVAQPTIPPKKPVKSRKVTMKQTTYIVELVRIKQEGGIVIEKKSRSDKRKKGEWKERFTPFDEKTGKSVEELIRKMNELC